MTEPTDQSIDLAEARADWQRTQETRCHRDHIEARMLDWFVAYAEPLLTALEQMQAALYHNPPFVPSPEPEGRTDDEDTPHAV